MNLWALKTDLFLYKVRGLQTQNQDRAAQLTKAAGCRCSSRVGRHFRRHSHCSRYMTLVHTDPVWALQFVRVARVHVLVWTTNKTPSLLHVFTFINIVFLSLHFHYYMYSPSLTLYSSLFTFIHLCRHCIRFLIQTHRQLLSRQLTSVVTPLTDIITSIDHVFRSLLLSPLLVLLIVSSGALFIRWIGNCTIKTHIIFCIIRTVN